MRRRTLIHLGSAAIVAVVVAAFIAGSRKTDETAEMQPTRLFPELGAKVGDVASITVAGAKQKLTIVKSGDDWLLREKSNYPAKPDAVRGAIAGLVEIRAIEQRTDKPELYDKIGVDDIDKPDSKAIRLALADAGGKELAALLLGTTKSYASGSHPAEIYVRKPGEARSWLAEGQLEIKTDPTTWMDRDLTKISRDRVMAVEIVQPNGDKLVQSHSEPKQEDWKVEGLPAGTKPKTTDLNGTGSALEFLSMEDVAKAADVAFDKPITATFRTFDGLVVTVKNVKKDGKPWIQLAATFDKDQAAKFAAAKPAAQSADNKGAAEAKSVPPKSEGPMKAPAEVEKEAAEIQQKFGPWAYQIPDYQAGNFTRTPAELVMTDQTDKKSN